MLIRNMTLGLTEQGKNSARTKDQIGGKEMCTRKEDHIPPRMASSRTTATNHMMAGGQVVRVNYWRDARKGVGGRCINAETRLL